MNISQHHTGCDVRNEFRQSNTEISEPKCAAWPAAQNEMNSDAKHLEILITIDNMWL